MKKSFIRAVWVGILGGFKWYAKTIKENKWYIIPCIIDIVLIPIKIVIIPLACFTKCGRKIFITLGRDVLEESED